MKNTILIIISLILVFLGIRFFYSSEPEIRNALPSGENIICFGDSLTYGTGASEGMDYPSLLSKMLSMPVINPHS